MDDYRYRALRDTLDAEGPLNDDADVVRVKTRNPRRESHWASLPAELFDRWTNFLRPLPDGCVRVTFAWSTEHGSCHNCPAPAAFLGDGERLYAVRTANAAVDGVEIRRIAPLD